jgi:hypothetical protein
MKEWLQLGWRIIICTIRGHAWYGWRDRKNGWQWNICTRCYLNEDRFIPEN